MKCIGSWDQVNLLKSIGVELREKSGGQKGDTRLFWQTRQGEYKELLQIHKGQKGNKGDCRASY